MFAVISDIHSNIDALKACLADMSSLGVEDLICLGDVVGYGPNPLECVDLVMQHCRVTLKGNHDEALIHGAYYFNGPARKAIDWTRETLRPGVFSGAAARRRWEYLRDLPLRYEEGPDVFIHGSPRDPTSEYILPRDVYGPNERFEEIFAGFERMLFVGHTHMPCVITDRYQAKTSNELGNVYTYPAMCDQKAIVNVGSVGQPRDRDPRACFVVVDGDTISWRRVEYDVAAAAAKIEAIPDLEPSLAARIRIGT